MTLMLVKFDSSDIDRRLKNSVDYSYGFLDGVEMDKVNFMRFLGGFVAEGLNKYIDSKARMHPNSLHHVYEPNMVGNDGGRLFKFNVVATKNKINFIGSFLPSKGISDTSKEPFVDKANIMENGIAITITPRNSDVLVFEDEGETVFVNTAIVIEHPGGDEVAGAFGEAVNDFFEQYLTNALLSPLIKDLSTADEFLSGFSSGGRGAGVKAGRQYLSVSKIGEIA
jgi:hypothetical protein